MCEVVLPAVADRRLAHRVLKTGCRIEQLAHKTAERLKRAIAINMVIAWRIMLMTLLGRQCPELPAEVLFSDLEIQVLQAYAKKTAERARVPGRCGSFGSEARRLFRPCIRSASRPSTDVAWLCTTATHVCGVRAERWLISFRTSYG